MWCGRLWLVALVVSGWLLGCGGAQEKADAVGDIATDLADARGDLADRVTDLGPDRVAVDAVPDVDDALAEVLDGADGADLPLCPADCDDGDGCTDDFCDPEVGCVNEPIEGCCPGQMAFAADFDGEQLPPDLTIETVVPPYTDKPELTSLTWQVDEGRFHSAPASLYFGDPETGDYDNGHRVAAEARLAGIALEPGFDHLLEFWTWMAVEEAVYSDFFTVQVETAEGLRVPVWTRTDIVEMKKWLPVQVDLSPFAGEEISLVFRFDSWDEHENSGEGIYVDDVTVRKVCEPPEPCTGDVHCHVPYPCMAGTCDGGACAWSVAEECCLTPADCEDWDFCTIEKCAESACYWQQDPDPLCCNSNEECGDDDPVCTVDVCKNGICQFLPSGAEGCCKSDSDCDDDDDCTHDYCLQLSCIHVNLCCTEDSECDDGDDVCTDDLCVDGKCVFQPSGAEGCCIPIFLEEGFESGAAAGWKLSASNPDLFSWQVSALEAYDGEMSLSCGSDAVEDPLSATAALPLTTIPPVGGKLTFYLLMDVEESGECDENALTVRFNDIPLQTFCNTLASWLKVEVPLHKYGGQSGELSLHFEADPWLLWDTAAYHVYVDKLKVTQECCSSSDDCDDGDFCTVDSCPGLNSFCEFAPLDGCCHNALQCDDGEPCTLDGCSPDHECTHTDICCESDGECDDDDDLCTDDSCVDGFCQFLPTGASGCCLPDVFMDGFESGEAIGWTLTNEDPEFGWQVFEGTANSGDYSLYFGNAAGTGYGSNSDGTAMSPPIAVPAGSEATLTLHLTYETESCCDKLEVKVVDEAGVKHALGTISGESFGWEEESFDLSPFVGQTVRLELFFHADGSVNKLGLFVDDIEVTIGCCSADADCDDDNPCTVDSCPGEASLCIFAPIPGCCVTSPDCDDGDPCTMDLCDGGTCQYQEICCESDEECDDGDDLCTNDLCVDGMCSYESTGADGCCLAEFLVAGFDEGTLDAGWEVDNLSNDSFWHVSDADSHSGTHSLAFTNEAGTSYTGNAEGTVTTPPVTLPVFVSMPALVFWAKFHTESCCDWWKLHLIVDEETIELGKYGGEEDWTEYTIDLSDYAGKTLRFQLEFHSDSSLSYDGVFIDDFRVEQACCSQDEDCEDFDPCTQDICPGTDSVCFFEPIEGCCLADLDCDDGDPCSGDYCSDYACFHVNLCCETDEDCDDGKPVCTLDQCVGGLCQFVPQYEPGCCFPKILKENFDAPLDAKWEFFSESGTYTWHVTTTKSITGTSSLYFGNEVGDSYGSSSFGTVTTPWLSIPVAPSAYLAFQVWLDTEANYDELIVHALHGDNEFLLAELSGNTVANWQLKELDLSNFVGKEIRIRFTFDSDGSKTFTGVWIEEVRVEVECCFADEDCDDGNPCTTGSCPGGGAMCTVEAIEGCCLSNKDCEDGDPCTLDQCKNGVCSNPNVCCESDADCDDGDDKCTLDLCVADFCVYEPTGAQGCCQAELFQAGFEGGDLEGWVVSNDQEDYGWHASTVAAAGGTWSLAFSDEAGESYGGSSAGMVRGPAVEIPDGALSPTLQLMARYDTESCCDEWSLSVWTSEGSELLGSWAGEADWTEMTFDLAPWKGKTVRIQLDFESDSSVSSGGIWIDDLAVTQGCCDVDEDCDDSNPCTVDTCPGLHSQCNFAWTEGCCVDATQCDDGNPCTKDGCTPDHLCTHVNTCCDTDDDCDDGDDLCTADSCVGGFCQFVATGAEGCCVAPLLSDDFSTDQGWQYGTHWQRGPATASDCTFSGEEDPGTDHSDGADNFLAGVLIGGCTPDTEHDYYFLTSPVIDAGDADTLFLSYWRFLNSDYAPYMTNVVQVYDGSTWQTVWVSGESPGIEDEAWTFQEHDISAHANPALRVRFGYKVEDDGVWEVSSWNLDDVKIYTTASGLCCTSAGDCEGFGTQCVLGACNPEE